MEARVETNRDKTSLLSVVALAGLLFACVPQREENFAEVFPNVNLRTAEGSYTISEIGSPDIVAVCYFYTIFDTGLFALLDRGRVISASDIADNCDWCDRVDIVEQSFRVKGESLVIVLRGTPGIEVPIDPPSRALPILGFTSRAGLDGPCYRPNDVEIRISRRGETNSRQRTPPRQQEN